MDLIEKIPLTKVKNSLGNSLTRAEYILIIFLSP